MNARWMLVAGALAIAACAPEEEGIEGENAAVAEADPDLAVSATGLPSGFEGRVDRADARIEEVRYAPAAGGAWEVSTGPAHILYQAGDTASGSYTASTTLQLLERPQHPEAFGVFIGGQDLQGAGQRYAYFLVRGTGEYLVKVREGNDTRTVVNWTASPAVPQADASGRASYPLSVRVGADSVRFLVGGQPVAAVGASAVPTSGVAGLRINHNLHVTAEPIRIER